MTLKNDEQTMASATHSTQRVIKLHPHLVPTLMPFITKFGNRFKDLYNKSTYKCLFLYAGTTNGLSLTLNTESYETTKGQQTDAGIKVVSQLTV